MPRSERERTYSVAWLAALFVLLAAVGIALLVFVGSPAVGTDVVATRQTLPDEQPAGAPDDEPVDVSGPDTDETDGTDDTGTSTTAPTSVAPTSVAPTSVAPTTRPPGAATFPDGSAAPAGVSEVLVAGGTTSLTFEAPVGVTLEDRTAVVPPTSAAILAEGPVLGIRVGCARSADEFLAQISVSETDELITVLAVVLAPDGGAPCASGSGARVIEVPLGAPVGNRRLVVVPPGTTVPEIGQL